MRERVHELLGAWRRRVLTPSTAKSAALLAGIGIVLVVLVADGTMLRRWWTGDDPLLVYTAYRYPHFEYFFLPELVQELSPAVLAPWLPFSLGLDLQLAGLHPFWFYVHQLTALAIAGFATVVLLRLWLNPCWSFAGAVLFLCGAVTVTMAGVLNERHYIEGLSFSILALYLYIRALRNGTPALAWIGAFFYFLAMTAKEIYVPLAVLLPFLPEGKIPARARAWLPYALAAALYALWRRYMLDAWIGGYAHGPPMGLSTFLRLPRQIFEQFFGNGYPALCASVVAMILVLYLSWQMGRRAVWFLLAAGLILAPILSVAFLLSTSSRFLILAWWAVSLAVVAALARLAETGWLWRIGAAAILIALVSISQLHAARIQTILHPEISRDEVEGRWMLESRPGQALFRENLSWFLAYLIRIREDLLGSPAPLVFSDEIELRDKLDKGTQLLRYEDACRCLRDVTCQIPTLLQNWAKRLRDTPLTVSMQYKDNLISWRFGPYPNGSYWIIFIIEPSNTLKIPLSAEGMYAAHLRQPMIFRIRYDAPDGWTTYSELLRLDTPGQVVWSR